MWIVRVALDRPYTFVVLALLILLLSPVIILRTATDIFPNINIPVIAVAWQYTGLNPEETEGRITSAYERILTTTVDNIEHIESTTVNGQVIIKIFLQPTASVDTANALVTSVSQTPSVSELAKYWTDVNSSLFEKFLPALLPEEWLQTPHGHVGRGLCQRSNPQSSQCLARTP